MLARHSTRLLGIASTIAAASLALDVHAEEPPLPPPPPQQLVPVARLHVNGTYPSTPVETMDLYGVWQPVCYGACDADLPLGRAYRVPGLGSGASDTFVLVGVPGEGVVVDVTPKVSHRGAMIGLFSAGGGLMLVGGVVALCASLAHQLSDITQNANGTPVNPYDPSGAYRAAEVMVGLGAVAALGGVVAAMSGENATVTQRGTMPTASAGTDDRWLRLPEREEPRHLDLAPRATTLPVFTASF